MNPAAKRTWLITVPAHASMEIPYPIAHRLPILPVEPQAAIQRYKAALVLEVARSCLCVIAFGESGHFPVSVQRIELRSQLIQVVWLPVQLLYALH